MRNNDTFQRKFNAEKKKILGILEEYNLPEKKLNLIMPIIENVAWMQVKLDFSRKSMRDEKIAIPYDNGGGQSGMRENPIFKAYESLWKAYMCGISAILQQLPAEAIEEIKTVEAPKTMLELIKSKKDRGA